MPQATAPRTPTRTRTRAARIRLRPGTERRVAR